MCLGVGSRQYCRYTKFPLGITPVKESWEFPRVNENLTSVGFEPTTSGLDLPMLYRLSYEASTGAGRGMNIRELTNRRRLHDSAAKLRDMLTAHASRSTLQLRAKGDDLRGSGLPVAWKQDDVRLVLQSFLSILREFF